MSIQKFNSPFHSLDLSQIKHFHAIATFGGFSKACRATGISQPALSQGLRKIEQVLGVRLIDRSANVFSLTPAGMRLLAFCQGMEEKIEGLVRDLGSSSVVLRRRMRVGTGLSIGFGPLARLCAANEQINDPYEVELSPHATLHVLAEVTQGELDAALVPDDVHDARLSFVRLFRDELIFVHGAAHKRVFQKLEWADAAAEIALITYPRETPTRSLIDKLCTRENLRFRAVITANSLDAIRLLAKAGVGGTFVMHSLVEDDLRRGDLFTTPLPFPAPSSGVTLATRMDERGGELAKTLLKMLK